jgi:hypothetical protein
VSCRLKDQVQIAEVALAGRGSWSRSAGTAGVPRRVYGRDQMRWRWDNGDYHTVVADGPQGPTTVHVLALGRGGLQLRGLRSGVKLAGHLVSVDGASFASDLEVMLRQGDDIARAFVRVETSRGRGEVSDPFGATGGS